MPKNKFEGYIYAFITVFITVPCFVFYCLSIENGGILNVDVCFALLLIPIEFFLAYLSELFIGSPLATKMAFKIANPKECHPIFFQIAIICSTVCVMCPWMSLLANILYHGIFPGIVFQETSFEIGRFIFEFIPNFLQTVILNFPFALLMQLFFIQPLVQKIFKYIFRKKTKLS